MSPENQGVFPAPERGDFSLPDSLRLRQLCLPLVGLFQDS